ncbi:MAG: glutathione S-transferase family protein [Rhodospirillales bacterium]|jgi:GST-like protein|nr:glutathione S-transferase family protein [Rhodospirillales bacterium]
MFDLYTWKTDNGFKARQMAEETGIEYRLKPVNLRQKEQFDPEYLKISPSHKIPAIIDHDGPGGVVTLCESGAILKYLAENYVPALYPDAPALRPVTDQWFFYGTSTFTPLAQQFGHFTIRSPEKVPKAQEHYQAVLCDMLGILDKRLGESAYLAGDEYTIADISCYPDVHKHGVDEIGLDDYPNLARWHDAIEARPAVQRGWTDY